MKFIDQLIDYLINRASLISSVPVILCMSVTAIVALCVALFRSSFPFLLMPWEGCVCECGPSWVTSIIFIQKMDKKMKISGMHYKNMPI